MKPPSRRRLIVGRVQPGHHFQAFERVGILSRQQQRQVLRKLSYQLILAVLDRYPVKTLSFVEELTINGVPCRGGYAARETRLVVNVPPRTYGLPFLPGRSWSVSEAGRTMVAALARTVDELPASNRKRSAGGFAP